MVIGKRVEGEQKEIEGASEVTGTKIRSHTYVLDKDWDMLVTTAGWLTLGGLERSSILLMSLCEVLNAV